MTLLLIGISSFHCFGQDTQRVKVMIPSCEQETAYVWRTIQDINFFDENGYQISLPPGDLIETLKTKSRRNALVSNDYSALLAYMQAAVYDSGDYQEGYDRVTQEITLLNQMIDQITETTYDWDFKIFDTYTVRLTLYGPGGSYDPDEGSILLYTTIDGLFKQYDNPINTLIHEVTHIGIEASIINRYNVPHSLKERIVDTFVYLSFGDLLPDYRLQEMGDNRIDKYLESKDDLVELSQKVEKFLKTR